MHGEDSFGYIRPFTLKIKFLDIEISDEKELLAVRWFINEDVDGKQFTAKVTCLIHPNGKIILYYDNIPTEIKDVEWNPVIMGKFKCGESKKHFNECCQHIDIWLLTLSVIFLCYITFCFYTVYQHVNTEHSFILSQ
ncbi:hypothetical protein MS3_00008217 [Schistosoma haematobium]|uniref:Uncharacterized protein n=1 Tax=Schistosoma haematobium TaxID=6185 RepID=A0A922IPJ1_SCHHA|nr:hypothetical protein MS3_00008217 [Schistosoma haematobium]KAH9583977.1 hypothetical protein MS3_00008217 [Schistosoma haematobium]